MCVSETTQLCVCVCVSMCANQVTQLAVIEEFKLNREELEERIRSLEEEISQREDVNRVQLEQQDREQVEGKNKYETTVFSTVIEAQQQTHTHSSVHCMAADHGQDTKLTSTRQLSTAC